MPQPQAPGPTFPRVKNRNGLSLPHPAVYSINGELIPSQAGQFALRQVLTGGVDIAGQPTRFDLVVLSLFILGLV